MAKKFIDEFNVKYENYLEKDYEVFENKKLLDELRNKIIQNIIDNSVYNDLEIKKYIKKEVDSTLLGYDLSLESHNYIYNLIENEINGYGPLTALINDPNVTEIMVNKPNEIYIEVGGVISKDDSISFINDEHIIRTINRMVGEIGRTLDSSNPMVDARLKDGSRINAIIPPLSIDGPVLTIRKFKKNIVDMEELIRIGTLTPYMARFLTAAVEAKLNILVCGGTGSGKTTLLNVLSKSIGDQERVITIEDACELNLEKEHVISLETRFSNYKTDNDVTIRDLVRNSLRMRPDRIIVGEVRGEEAFDMLQAMNTGHDGSLTTIHANSPIDALNRLETNVLLTGIEIPIKAIREYVKNAINLVVNIERLSDGKRKVTSISEIKEIKDDEIKLREIFSFHQIGLTENNEVDGEFKLNKVKAKSYEIMKSKGITLDEMFK